ncbi:MAG: hypothetical protein ACYTGY_03365 [Planctomycetota bacterium]
MQRMVNWVGWRDGAVPRRCLNCHHVDGKKAANNINNKAVGIERIGPATTEAPDAEQRDELKRMVLRRAEMVRTRRRGPVVSPEVARMRLRTCYVTRPGPGERAWSAD